MSSESVPADAVEKVRLTVAIPTFRRVGLLGRLLADVDRLVDVPAGYEVDLLVVDNDAAGTARPTVEAFEGRLGLRYVIEHEPGIAAARQRILDETADRDLVVMLDDDVVPEQPWLGPLLGEWERTKPAAVVGLLRYEHAAGTPDWFRGGRFFSRTPLPRGTRVPVAACGNILFDRSQVARLQVTFDRRLGRGGGEDSLFTSQLSRRGGRVVTCHDSVAAAPIPPDRATWKAAFTRARSHGNATVRIRLLEAESGSTTAVIRVRAIAGGAARMAVGPLAMAAGLLTRNGRRAGLGYRTLGRGFGMLEGGFGSEFEEYLVKD